jgi:hypothetical protein
MLVFETFRIGKSRSSSGHLKSGHRQAKFFATHTKRFERPYSALAQRLGERKKREE